MKLNTGVYFAKADLLSGEEVAKSITANFIEKYVKNAKFAE